MEETRIEKTSPEAAPMEESPGDPPYKMSTFEDLLELVGTCGRWNILMFCMCSISSFTAALPALSYQFLGATPDHWCSVEPLREANWTQQQVLNFAIPFSNSTGKYQSCFMYDLNYTAAAEAGYDDAMANRWSFGGDSNGTIKCQSRDFNLTQYQSTVVTEWDLVCERRVLYSSTQSVVMGGKLLGFIVFGYLIDQLGRRPLVLFCTTLNILSSFLIAASPNVETYIFFKFVITMMDAGQYLGLFVFIMETCATKYRAAAGTLFVIPWALGYMAVPGIAYLARTWKVLQLAYAIPTLLATVFFVWLPESPRWLIIRGRHQEALKVMTQAAKVNKKTMPSDDQVLSVMRVIAQKPDTEDTDEDKGILIRVRLTLRRFFILFILPEFRVRSLVVIFCWCGASLVYYGLALNADNINTDPYLYVFFGGILEVPSYLLLWLALLYIGRKKALSALFFICGIFIFVLMTLIVLQLPGSEWAVVTFSQGGKVAITAAFQLAWMFTAELYPTSYRSFAVGMGSVFARLGAMASPYINDILGMREVWAPSALFGSVSLVAAVVTLLLPETGDSNLSEPTYSSDTKERKETARKDVSQSDSVSKNEASKAHENLSYVAED